MLKLVHVKILQLTVSDSSVNSLCFDFDAILRFQSETKFD